MFGGIPGQQGAKSRCALIPKTRELKKRYVVNRESTTSVLERSVPRASASPFQHAQLIRPYRYRKTQPTDEGAVLTCGQYGAILSDELQPSETQQVR